MAVIVSSNYKSNDLTLESGPLRDHKTDNIWYVDLKSNETWKNYRFGKGEIVLYADSEKYVLFKDCEMITYDAKTQNEISRKEALWYEKNCQHSYEIVLCNNHLFVFSEEGLVGIEEVK